MKTRNKTYREQPTELRPKASKSKLLAEEVERAIYIDYEGNMDRPPTLLGWYVDGTYHASIIEPLFATCSNRYRTKSVDVTDHEKLALRLLEQAEEEKRLIVSWSEHDYLHMSKVLNPIDKARLQLVYRNAIKTAKPWYRNKFGSPTEKAKLQFFEDLLGFYVPERFGLGLVGESLRLIREQIEKGRTYSDLTKAAKTGWISVVRHNKFDLQGMAFVLNAITRRISS
jgi:hypothetical protein